MTTEFTVRKGNNYNMTIVKFIYSEKAKKFCEIFPLLLTVFKSKGKISENFAAFSEYMNFKQNSAEILPKNYSCI